jgi:hypothetical protein
MNATHLLCLSCRHLRDGLTCDAFPDRIPVAILDGRADHHQPYPSDHGIQFAPKDDDVDEDPAHITPSSA